MIKDGEPQNMKYHQERFERTRRERLGEGNHPLLEDFIRPPFGLPAGIVKCRIVYGKTVGEVTIGPYSRPRINSLRLVYNDQIDYSHKACDRDALSELFVQKGDCDDILIVKNGCITDSYLANVVFLENENWLTPDTPLLPGCMRAKLLEEGRISEARITPSDLQRFSRVRLINALNSMEEGIELPIEGIRAH